MSEKIKLEHEKLNRKKKDDDNDLQENTVERKVPVSAGAVDKAIDLAFNPTREKIREVTIIDRVQGRIFPILDLINAGRQHVIEIAVYRQDSEAYKKLFKKPRPILPNLLDEYMFRTAQWQKSVEGTNLTKITDIALAETETRIGEEDKIGGYEPWKED